MGYARKIALALITTSLFGSIAHSQEVWTRPLSQEQPRASALAVEFVNQFRGSGDIRPLVGKYFVEDFRRRLEFCRTTSDCEGSGRDFWKGSREGDEVRFSRDDYMRHYTALMNVFLLSWQAQNYLAVAAQKKPEEYEQEASNALNGRLRTLLKKPADWTLWAMLEGKGDNGLRSLNTTKKFRKHLSDLENVEIALRRIKKETHRAAVGKVKPKADLLKPDDFEAYDEPNDSLFFDFPVGTRIIQIWPKELVKIPFVIDIASVNGKMKIVAVYPPID